MTSEKPAISVLNLTKRYGNLLAVDGIHFKVQRGRIFGFLGPNGAGKTTTIKAILGLIKVDEGEIEINGMNIKENGKEVKRSIGYLPERVSFYDNLTALQNLSFYAELKGSTNEECKALLEEVGLGQVMNKKVRKFSRGMVQRLGIARSLLGDPDILILDEPSTGLDPEGSLLVKEKLRSLNGKGCTIFLSSHILAEVQAMCSDVIIINKGKLVAEGRIEDLSRKLEIKPKITISLDEKPPENILNELSNMQGIYKVEGKGSLIEVTCEPEVKVDVLIHLKKSGLKIKDFETRTPSLEKIFMKCIKEGS